jgi:hypothetical protein
VQCTLDSYAIIIYFLQSNVVIAKIDSSVAEVRIKTRHGCFHAPLMEAISQNNVYSQIS